MRPVAIFGAVLLVLGVIVLARGLTFKSKEDVARIGDLHIQSTERHTVPTWAGVLAVAGGVVLIGAGVTQKKAA